MTIILFEHYINKRNPNGHKVVVKNKLKTFVSRYEAVKFLRDNMFVDNINGTFVCNLNEDVLSQDEDVIYASIVSVNKTGQEFNMPNLKRHYSDPEEI